MQASSYKIRRTTWQQEKNALRAVRNAVFILEQGVPQEMEWDQADEEAIHLLVEDANGRPIGTGRLLNTGQIGRMAVMAAWRGKGIGSALLKQLLVIAKDSGISAPFLNAQVQAIEFYRRAGLHTVGKEFFEAGIAHYRMELD